jgi:hypothetical protein
LDEKAKEEQRRKLLTGLKETTENCSEAWTPESLIQYFFKDHTFG